VKGAFTTRVSPNGRYVVCADVHSTLAHFAYFDGSNSVNLFERDQSTGTLTLLHSFKNGENGIENLDYVVDACFIPSFFEKSPLSRAGEHHNYQVTLCIRFVTTDVDFFQIESE